MKSHWPFMAVQFIAGLLLTLLMIHLALAADPPRVTLPTQLEGMDRMTFVTPLDQGHPLCFGDDNPETNKTIRFYRYRVEGGPKVLYLDYPADLWVPQQVAYGNLPIMVLPGHP